MPLNRNCVRGEIINNKIKSEKFRKLSVAALVTGILAFTPLFMQLGPIMRQFMPSLLENIILVRIIISLQFMLSVLPIAAVVCGSIDLKRIKAGHYSNKGRGFDIAGIILGGIFILFISVFLLLELIFPH